MLCHHSFSLRKKYMLLRKDEIELDKLGVMLIRICCWSTNSFCYESQIVTVGWLRYIGTIWKNKVTAASMSPG